jgi:hypothetical protein
VNPFDRDIAMIPLYKTEIASVNYRCSAVSFFITFLCYMRLMVLASIIIAPLIIQCECGADVCGGIIDEFFALASK